MVRREGEGEGASGYGSGKWERLEIQFSNFVCSGARLPSNHRISSNNHSSILTLQPIAPKPIHRKFEMVLFILKIGRKANLYPIPIGRFSVPDVPYFVLYP